MIAGSVELEAAESAISDAPLADRHVGANVLDRPEQSGRIYVHALVHRIAGDLGAPMSLKTLRTLQRFYRAMAIELGAIAAEQSGADNPTPETP